MEHVIMMHAKDNIAIVMAPSLAVGSEFTVGGKMVCAKDELPFAHKVAIKAIPRVARSLNMESRGDSDRRYRPRRARSRA